jgi:uncharacterized membrane protein
MGGVAIAISLVPPLCVVGIALQEGHMDAAGGALLLFATNYLAILLAGGIVLALVGLGKSNVVEGSARTRKRGFVLFITGMILVAIPLSLSSYQSVVSAIENQKATVEVEKWLEGTTYVLDTVNVDDRITIITVEGSGALNSLQPLANNLASTLKRPVLVNLRTIPIQIGTSTSP